jgi:hypothetical protein
VRAASGQTITERERELWDQLARSRASIHGLTYEWPNEMAVIRLRIVSPSNQSPYTLEELARSAVCSGAGATTSMKGLSNRLAAIRAWRERRQRFVELRRIQRLRHELRGERTGVAVIVICSGRSASKAELERSKPECVSR